MRIHEIIFIRIGTSKPMRWMMMMMMMMIDIIIHLMGILEIQTMRQKNWTILYIRVILWGCQKNGYQNRMSNLIFIVKSCKLFPIMRVCVCNTRYVFLERLYLLQVNHTPPPEQESVLSVYKRRIEEILTAADVPDPKRKVINQQKIIVKYC